MRNLRISTAVVGLAGFALAGQFSAQQTPKDTPVVPPLTSVSDIFHKRISRGRGIFYVGGKWGRQTRPGSHAGGAMYVETWVPKKIRYKYPILFIQAGGGETNVALLQNPGPGGPGWAYDFCQPRLQPFT